MSRVAHPAGPWHADVLPPGYPPPVPASLNALDPAIWPRTARRSGGAVVVGGISVNDLAARFGTPLFACDEADFRARCREFHAAFGPGAGVSYAAKAFCCRTVLRWATQEGLGVDVCTGGELEVALGAGVRPEKITLHGSNKLADELERALAVGVGHIVADSFDEIGRLAALTSPSGASPSGASPSGASPSGASPSGASPSGNSPARGRRPRVLVRVTTGVEAAAHEFVATAHDDQKFGFSLASGAADEAVRRVLASPGLHFAGLHSHIGSQIYDTAGFDVAAHRVIELAVRIRDEHGISIEELNLGGGFGIAYTAGDDPADVRVIARGLRDIVEQACRAAGLPRPRVSVEPGRAIAGPGTITVYRVGTVKDVDGLRTYVSIDGGMSDNIRTALYDADYTCVLASRESAAPPMLSRIVGRHCESGDIVVRDAYLPADTAAGDLVAVAATGAYCRSMASNYNHVLRPPVVAVAGGEAMLMLRRETIEDVLSLDAG